MNKINFKKLLCLMLVFIVTNISYGEDLNLSNPVKLKVAILPYLSYAPFFIAEEEKLFADQNLQVEFIKMNKTAMAVAALITGGLDVLAGTVWPSHINAIARGARIKFVANRSYVAPEGCVASAILIRRELSGKLETQDLSNLNELRVGVNPSSYMAYIMDAFFHKYNISRERVRFFDLSPPVRIEAFRKGTVDIVIASEPWLTRTLNTDMADVYTPIREFLPGLQWSFIIYGSKLMDKNQDAGNRFMLAYLKAVKQYEQGKTDRNVGIVKKYTELSEEVLRDICWPEIRKDGQINFELFDEFQNWALRKGLLDSKLAKDQLLDSRFIKFAAKELEFQN